MTAATADTDGHPAIVARPWREGTTPKRVLAIRLHAFGDTIITLPYLSALSRRLPGATLDLLTRTEVAEVPRELDLFGRVFEIGGGRSPRRIALSALAMVPRLVLRRYDVVLDLQRSRVSRMVRMLLRPRAWSEFDRISPRLAGERTRLTIEAVGLGALDVRPDLTLRSPNVGETALRVAGWDGASDIIVLNPGGSFSGRSWPLESYVRFAELCGAERDRPTQFAVMGLPALSSKSNQLSARLGRHRLLDLTGRTGASEAFGILARAALVVSEDSGLMHMAWVAGAPTLGLFGASKGAWARPHGSYCDWVGSCRRGDGACLSGRCAEGSPTCLERVTPEEVVERASRLLERVARAPKRIHVDGHAYAPPLAGESGRA